MQQMQAAVKANKHLKQAGIRSVQGQLCLDSKHSQKHLLKPESPSRFFLMAKAAGLSEQAIESLHLVKLWSKPMFLCLTLQVDLQLMNTFLALSLPLSLPISSLPPSFPCFCLLRARVLSFARSLSRSYSRARALSLKYSVF